MKKCNEYMTFERQLKSYCGSGTKSRFFREMLAPDWWTGEEMSGNKNLTFSLVFTVAHRLGVSLLSLLNDGNIIADELPSSLAYKIREGDNKNTVERTSAFLFQLAKTTLAGIDKQDEIGRVPEKMRESLLKNYKSADFPMLLDYCWNLGIPVLSVTDYAPHGAGWHRPQAAVFKDDGKYCIFILENNTFNARPLFLLAHELGHIAAGHLDGENDCCHLDDRVECGLAEDNEGEANAFALKLLCGNYDFKPCPSTYSKTIADWAVETGKTNGINAGHLILRDVFAKTQGQDDGTRKKINAIGTTALKIINQTEDTKPQNLIRSKEFENLREDNYKDEEYEFITKGTGLNLEETEN